MAHTCLVYLLQQARGGELRLLGGQERAFPKSSRCSRTTVRTIRLEPISLISLLALPTPTQGSTTWAIPLRSHDLSLLTPKLGMRRAATSQSCQEEMGYSSARHSEPSTVALVTLLLLGEAPQKVPPIAEQKSSLTSFSDH